MRKWKNLFAKLLVHGVSFKTISYSMFGNVYWISQTKEMRKPTFEKYKIANTYHFPHS